MIRALLAGALWVGVLLGPALAGEPGEPERDPQTDSQPGAEASEGETEHAVPDYTVLHLARSADANGPQAVVRTDARTEDEWIAIGRDLRAKRPAFNVMVVYFVSDQAPALPDGYPRCGDEERRTFERWMLGSYLYQSRSYLFNPSGKTIEQVKQEIVTPRARTLAGVDVTELRAPDLETTLEAPAPLRFVSVSVVVPGLERPDLEKVARAYEDEFGSPRLLSIVFFDETPDWPDKPFATSGLYKHAGSAYLRSSTVEGTGARQRVVPVEPRWMTLEDGEVVEQSSPAK